MSGKGKKNLYLNVIGKKKFKEKIKGKMLKRFSFMFFLDKGKKDLGQIISQQLNFLSFKFSKDGPLIVENL